MTCDGRCQCGAFGESPVAAGDETFDVELGRREFVTRTLLSAVASMMAAGTLGCGNGIIGGDAVTAPTSLGGGVGLKLSDYPQLANVGGIASIGTVAGTPLAVARTATDTFVAVSMVCTHQGTIVNITSGGFTCPNHGARFGADGHWLGGQQTSSLVTYPVTYDKANGTLQVGGTVAVTIASIAVQPSSSTLAVGQSVQLTATLRDNAGAVVTGRPVTWSAANSGTARVDASGLVTAVAAGTTSITATSDAVSTTANITVTAGQPAGGLVVDPALFPALSAVGGIARVDSQQAGTLPVAVVRTGTSTWAAFSMVCPHAGTTINIVSGGFLCPNHGARFNAAGANTGGQQTSSLTSLPVTVQTNGTLLIAGTGSAPPPPPPDDD